MVSYINYYYIYVWKESYNENYRVEKFNIQHIYNIYCGEPYS